MEGRDRARGPGGPGLARPSTALALCGRVAAHLGTPSHKKDVQVDAVAARDVWHLSHRVIRKVLSHTVAVWINVAVLRNRPLDFDSLITW